MLVVTVLLETIGSLSDADWCVSCSVSCLSERKILPCGSDELQHDEDDEAEEG